jgi:hypothetical protein
MADNGTTPAGNQRQELPKLNMDGGKKSAWMTHVKKTMRANKGKPLSAVLKMAAKSYKKTAKVSKKKKSRGLFGMYGGLSTSAGPDASTAGDVGGQMEGMGNYGSMGGRRRNSKKNGSKKY